MKRVLIGIMLLAGLHAAAQDYHTGIGIRLGGLNTGITVKHFVNSQGAIEGSWDLAMNMFY
jgi:hypothetical protein